MVEKNCLFCKKDFKTKFLRSGGAKYCCRECVSKARRGSHLSEENLKKIREAMKAFRGIPRRPEVSAKISETRKGRFYTISDETRKRMSDAQKGKHIPEEVRRKMSKSHMGKKIPPEVVLKGVESRRGFRHSEETKKRLSEKKKGIPSPFKGIKRPEFSGERNPMFGKKLSEEAKEKIRKSRLGKKASEETKKKFSLQRMGNKYCLGYKHTEETLKKMSECRRGEKSTFWKGGITPINKAIRVGPEHSAWSRQVFRRDNWRCQKTGEKGNKKNPLNAHHILNFATHPEIRFDVNNGITLSLLAHREFHHLYGIKNNTKEQLEEFLGRKI